MSKSNIEGLGAEEFAKRSWEHEKTERETAGRFVAMLLPKDWMDPTLIHTLGEITGIKRAHLNDALDSAIEDGIAEASLSEGIRASDKVEVSDEQIKFIEQMQGLLKVREETDEFIAYELKERLTAEALTKAS